ncbi:pectate lyase family protein [Maribellus sediminis]|uniref:pectate lyase family protein n=1 Tax=Maribellus sediminis TaxID=2696285 RepID=UPI0014300CA3|nr:pectate lyase [Maribellus sediminis]
MRFLLAFLLVIAAHFTQAQTPAFPGAEGGGKYVTGGRGGKVLFVDNLNDKGNGSFRKAIETEGPRTIIFRVSGTIELKKTLHIRNNDLTIAGQTAPGDGICLKNYGIRVDADNVIIRYIRVRPGDEAQEENDAIYGLRRRNVIIDHCSFSWADDEVASFYDNENFTLQWCILSESMYHSFHHKGNHGYGGIWGGLNASFHHNLISDHTSRNPRFCGSRYSNDPESEKTDFRNNVIYNWGFNSAYGGEEGYYNMVNNYYKPGSATRKDVRDRILNLTQEFFNASYNTDTLGAGWFYINGNVVEGHPEISSDNWNGGVQGKGVNETTLKKSRLSEPVEHAPVTTTDAETAYKQVLQSVGASLARDAVDKRVIEEARTGNEKYGKTFGGGGVGIIDSPAEVGGWPELKSLEPPLDSDKDGMPDDWEKKYELDPTKADNNLYTIDKAYTNLEVYINSLVTK